jgi:hypothetical protein
VPLPTSNVSEHPAIAVFAKENGMPRLETLSEINRQAMLSFPCLEPGMTPWSPFHWFWGETAVAQLIRAVSQRMSANDDPTLKYFAYSVTR